MCLTVARKLADPDPKITTIARSASIFPELVVNPFPFPHYCPTEVFPPYLRPSLGHFPSVLTTFVLTFQFAL